MCKNNETENNPVTTREILNRTREEIRYEELWVEIELFKLIQKGE